MNTQERSVWGAFSIHQTESEEAIDNERKARFWVRFAAKVRAKETAPYRKLYELAKRMRDSALPRYRSLGMVLLAERKLRSSALRWLKNQYASQIIEYRCTSVGDSVSWDGDVPLVFGDGEIHLGDNVTIGNNCIIMKGVVIGRGAIVAAGSVVTKSVPEFTVVGGNPARILKKLTATEAGHESGAERLRI